ncbi:MAG: hypothetical protein KC897_06550 [Candidatus Omnitrophica bacterium]|nr:hypothetical protein [Candidatus Omnitrophota bacterium]MCB9720284.1 hypothetical protein [Candidatus Omnitrophota bacterium]
MILEKGEKIHVITRRLFDGDLRRHFIGEVKAASDWAARVEGYVFVYDSGISQFARREELRTRIISISDFGQIINVIPSRVELQRLEYKFNAQQRLVLTDGADFHLDINEFGTRT